MALDADEPFGPLIPPVKIPTVAPATYDEQTRRWLSILVAAAVLGYVYLVTLVKTNLSNELESIVINAMLMFVTGILGYWIGSSLGSTTKGKMLSEQSDKPNA